VIVTTNAHAGDERIFARWSLRARFIVIKLQRYWAIELHILRRQEEANASLPATLSIRSAISLTIMSAGLDSGNQRCAAQQGGQPMYDSPKIFVLDIPEGPDLAFPADGATQAAAIALAPWFRDAIRNVLAEAGQVSVAAGAQRIRAATLREARIYRELRTEFDWPTRQFLVANLSGFREQSAGTAAAALP